MFKFKCAKLSLSKEYSKKLEELYERPTTTKSNAQQPPGGPIKPKGVIKEISLKGRVYQLDKELLQIEEYFTE